ncbi:hypothetical protein [Chryseobacterium defluvii]|uniref:Uncharacterized protein n=1 Tax=Chryseobacterium defluvii TaxID=160396 RepID=A0A495SMU2_9FLAO|nr:hypothetical protein [Chryseobacterium defluvii]RKT01035.1 hypothetical protein BCF58_0246 [Chryseobacterium defluvii]
MDVTIDKKILDDLEKGFFINTILSYEPYLIHNLETSINVQFEDFYNIFESQVPLISEGDDFDVIENQQFYLNTFSLNDYLDVFNNFEYAINTKNKKIYFASSDILEIFSKFLVKVKGELTFTENDPVFDFAYYNFHPDAEEYRQATVKIIIDFGLKLNGFLLYRDFEIIFKQINKELIIQPNDNHIPIRIAILDSLNLINDLNNNVPNKENIYRIIHAIVGGNEDNVKKYCLSLIGKNSLSQKQITKKHKEFAQKYINEKKF